MGWLWLGVVLMAGAHFFSMLLPARRDALKKVLGEMPWKVAYSVVVLAGLALMIKGLLAARAGPLAADILYLPPDWTRHLTMLMVLAASASYIAAPAAMRLSLPEANPALYLTPSLAITFPFNIAFGIPIYFAAARWLYS